MSVKGFKNAFRSCPNSSDNFPDFSRIYSHFSLSIFYLLEGSKIFFMNSKHFIWIVHVPMCLWEFSWNFCDYRSIFRVFKQILGFSGIVFALKIISKKKKIYPIYLGRARRPDPGPHRPSCRPARGPSEPAGAHRPAAIHGEHAAAASCLRRARPGLLQPRPIKPRAELP
jgi:hypothetical protein